MSEPMSERRKGQHSAVHRLAQVFADLVLAEQDVKELDERSGKKTRALCFIRNSSAVIQRVIDTDLGPKLIDNEEKKKKKRSVYARNEIY